MMPGSLASGRRPVFAAAPDRAGDEPVGTVTTRTHTGYERAKDTLRAEFAAAPAAAPIRLGKRTSNLFRTRERARARLDVGGFDGVLEVDPESRTADVLGMTTYEHLVDATLPHGLVPLVVPQLKTITLGGAVAGLGIESTSFRNGMPHESVLEMEILTGDGRIVLARPDGEHADLFRGFPNSFGTLGYALRLRIELEPVSPYVALEHRRYGPAAECFTALEEISAERALGGRPVDFVDGTVFGLDELYLTLGRYQESAPSISDYTGMDIYYQSIRRRAEDHLTVRDYLWRWDTDWFWCSSAFGVQRPSIRRWWPKQWLRSDVYWRIVAAERRLGLRRRMDRLRGRPLREEVIQDVEVPIDRAAEFLDFFHREVRISPVWLCPLRVRDARHWPLYALQPGVRYVNFGFWSTVPLRPGETDGTMNRRIERVVTELGGRKSLYSTAFYEADEFWALYGAEEYDRLKKRYDGEGRLLGLYDKCVGRR